MSESPFYLCLGSSDGVIVNKLELKTLMSEFDSYWVPHSYGLETHQSKKLYKLQVFIYAHQICN